jgi:hypothetical protein
MRYESESPTAAVVYSIKAQIIPEENNSLLEERRFGFSL